MIPPDDGETGTLEAREFCRDVGRSFEIASFSSLIEEADRGVAVRDGLTELPDHDEGSPGRAAAAPAEPSDIFAFPRGPRAGKCLHAIFERLDFSRADRDDVRNIVNAALAEYGYEQLWCDTLCDMIGRVLETPLEMPPERGTGRRLSGLSREHCLHELSFYFPLKAITPKKLRVLFSSAGFVADDIPERMGSLRFQPVEGFMRGFIDLVFEHSGRYYLIDWKSNHLGNRPEDYGRSALAAAMQDDLYVLQYHLYAVALHEYLKGRVKDYDYDRHFGGVFYVFLRGVDPADGARLRNLSRPARARAHRGPLGGSRGQARQG